MPTDLEPIGILSGVEPDTDKPQATTRHYVDANRIRFKDGVPEKIGGWENLTFDGDSVLDGCSRTIYSYKLGGQNRYLLGSNTKLFDIFGSDRTNITPLKAATSAIANSLDTFHATLGSAPIATVSGSTTITITDTAHKMLAGDTVTLSGAAATNGVPAGDINVPQYVRSITANEYTIIVSTAATSTGSGGGASVVRASGVITVNITTHGRVDGDRVKILGAATFGGVTATQINKEFLIRGVSPNQFDIYTAGTSTSSATAGGGAGTTWQEEIATGAKDAQLGAGYGMGLYGVGLYGVSKVSSAVLPPRIWSHDRFGTLTLSAYNEQSDIYQWNGDRSAAPVKVANSPPSNYVFVSDNICVTLGYDTAGAAQKDNAISWTDQGGLTNWTTGQSGSRVIQGADKFLSHAAARGENLIFTEKQVYIFRYIGGEFIWQTRSLDTSVGLIAQNARVAANGIIYWMGNNNFYMWRGGNVEVIPANSSTESTILSYVFDDINFGQREKCFAWYNAEFREIWFHYPTASSNEPDRVARVNTDTFEWVYDEHDRTAAEYPAVITQTPYMVSSESPQKLYLHENGVNADGLGMDWRLKTNKIYGGSNTVQISAFVPDMSMTGSMNVNLTTRDYPLSADIVSKNYTLTNTSDRITTEINGRYWQFDLSGNTLDQRLEFGQWYHEVMRSAPKAGGNAG